jgi:hypothetical protein
LESIYVVQGLYTNASTRVHTPCGATPNINIDRGTLQGDTLSPLLFNIFIEPLLRWLQVGGRGYTYGCLKDCDDSAGGKGYADDIAAFAHHARDARIQAAKISRYSDWSDLKVNVTKSAASAILHGDAACGGKITATDDNRARRQLSNIRICGQPLPFLPSNKPYKYLGLQLTLTLDWHFQIDAVLDNLRECSRQLCGSFASEKQCLRVLKQCILPKITYSFPVAPYTIADIQRIDKEVAKLVRKAIRLPPGLPNAFIHEDVDKMGIGIPSLMVDYAYLNAKSLLTSLEDPGSLGAITRALLSDQLKYMGQVHPEQQPNLAKFCMNV